MSVPALDSEPDRPLPLTALQDATLRQRERERRNARREHQREPERTLCCRACNRPVTEERARIEVGGAQAHRRRNPVGLEYVFGCFASAPGCRDTGLRTAEHTWFSGYDWRIALCAGCYTHLGWHFQGRGHEFYGLIDERLRTSEHRGLH